MDIDDWTTLFLLAVHNTSITLLLRFARTVEPGAFDSSFLVCVVEAVKLTLALFFEASSYFLKTTGTSSFTIFSNSFFSSKVIKSLVSEAVSELGDRQTLLFLLIPSIAYSVQNNLYFVAMTRLSVVEYQIGMQLRVIWTALASAYFLRRHITKHQWILLCELAIGIALVQLGDYTQGGTKAEKTITLGSQIFGWLAMLGATAAAGTSGVLLEWLNETRKKPSVWIQVVQISAFTLCFSLAYYLVSSDRPIYTNRISWLTTAIITGQSVGGLLVVYVITAIGNIERIFSMSISIILSFICERVAFPAEKSLLHGDVMVVFGITVVLYAIWKFYMIAAEEEAKRGKLLPSQVGGNGNILYGPGDYVGLNEDLV